MAQKLIYVKDEDLALFGRAEELGLDNLSAFVVGALRKFIEQKEKDISGLEEFSLQVDNWEQGEKTLKFTGWLLAEDRRYRGQTSEGKDRWTDWSIYKTKAGKIVIYREHGSLWQGEGKFISKYAVLNALPEYDDEIFGDEPVPGLLLEEAARKLGDERVMYIE